MDKTYQPHAIETSWYNTWESENYFAPQGAGESYPLLHAPRKLRAHLAALALETHHLQSLPASFPAFV